MNTEMPVLKTLADAMARIEAEYGIDVCLAQADAIYSGVYRSEEAYTFSELSAGVEYSECLYSELVEQVATHLATKAGKFIPLTREEYMDDMEADYSTVHEFKPMAKELIDNGLKFVDICNYKGESAGLEIADVARTYKVYKGKYDYR